ncbi:MAG TPA: aldo/keto reductase [Paenibacillus sp.]|uniref:aldo/keto reductase n=1 Tax=Paenibacillus sp. TaxID=58172 RepID=UPI0028D8F24F|nr:aldo/keto reductase [Paenibacillus sp.]HUC93469.1 aldo/keto reductase [Paenibacillus sp.]
MKYRRLGSTGLNVSVIGVGTWQFGGEWGKTYAQDEADAILSKAKELGINLIDTAECYGDHLSESLIGNYLRKDKREDWILATKFGHHYHGFVDRTDHWGAQEVLKQLDDSLKALATDYVDIYQFHSGGDEYFDNDDLWTALDKQVQAGKIRHLGVSLGSNENIHQTEASTRIKSEVIQLVYNRLDQKPERQVLPACQRQDLGVLAREPLANGFLGGKYKPGAVFAANDWRSRGKNTDAAAEQLKRVQEIERTELPEGVSLAAWSLAWCLKHPAVTAVIPGCKNVEHVISNAAAADLIDAGHPQDVSN